ncbi:hypothetical protein ACFE04_023177 [Oxalis oulophora]
MNPGTSSEYVVAEGRTTEIGWGNTRRPTSTSEWAALQKGNTSSSVTPPPSSNVHVPASSSVHVSEKRTKQSTKSTRKPPAKSPAKSTTKPPAKSTTKPPAKSNNDRVAATAKQSSNTTRGKSLAPPPLPKGHAGFKRSGVLCIPGRADWATTSQIKEQAKGKGKGKGKMETTKKRSEWR